MQWPTYDRAYKLFLLAGSSILVATVDDHGVDPVNVEVALVGHSTPAFMYLIPTFQNPTGTTLTDERRQSLVKFSQRRNVLIVEDDPYSLVRFEGEPLLRGPGRQGGIEDTGAQSLLRLGVGREVGLGPLLPPRHNFQVSLPRSPLGD